MNWDDQLPSPEEIARARATVRAKVTRLRRRQRLRRAGLVGVTVTALISAVLVGGDVHRSRSGQTIQVIAPPDGSSTPSKMPPSASCSSRATGSAMAYATYQIKGRSQTYVTGISLPSAKIRWTALIPKGMAVDAMAVAPDGATLYTVVESATHGGRPELLPIDSASGSLGAPLRLPGTGPVPQGLAISPNGRSALVAQAGDLAYPVQVSGELGTRVTLINLAHRTVEGTIAVGPGPSGVAFARDSTTAYATTIKGLRRIDIARRAVTATVPLAQDGALVVTNNDLALTTSQGEDLVVPPSTISVVNLRTLRTEKPVSLPQPAGSYVIPVAASCDGATAYALSDSNIIYRIAIAGRTVSVLAQVHRQSDIAESPDQRQVWAVSTTNCDASACEWQFLRLDPEGVSDTTRTMLPPSIGLLAIGPAMAATG